MSKALVAQILDAIKDAHYVDGPISLGHYHKAEVIRNALRCRTPQKRLSVIREALNAYRVTSWLTDTGQIRLVKDGKDILIIG